MYMCCTLRSQELISNSKKAAKQATNPPVREGANVGTHLCVVALWEALDEPSSVGSARCSLHLLQASTPLPKGDILEDVCRKQHWLLQRRQPRSAIIAILDNLAFVPKPFALTLYNTT